VVAAALALFAAACFGLADFVGGVASRRLALVVVLAVSQLASLAAIGAVVLVRGEGPPAGKPVALAILAGGLGIGALAALYRALAVGSMSVVAPIAGAAAVIPVIAGVVIGERPSAVQNVGIVLALVGVVLASRTAARAAGRSGVAAGVGLAVLAAIGIGFFLVAFDAASEPDPYWASLVQRTTAVTILWTVLLALRAPLRLAPRDRLVLPVIGLLDIAGTTAFAVATTTGLIGVVSVLVSLYPVVTVALARFVLHERLTRLQAAGVAVALAGIGLITAG
jgi:drug/metabolite transporter (DMT)-like permease